MSGTVAAGIVRAWLTVARGMGLQVDHLLARSGLVEASITSPDRVPADALFALVRMIVEETGVDDLGLRLGSAGRWGLVAEYAIRHAPTLGAGLDQGVRFSRLISDQARIAREDRDGYSAFRGHYPAEDADLPWPVVRQFVDAWTAALIATSRQVTNREVVPVRVRVAYPEPRDTRALRDFLRCDVDFDCGVNETWLSTETLALPVVGADSALGAAIRAHCDHLLAALPRTERTVDRARRELAVMLSRGDATVHTLARALAMSERTLQRRLADDGTSYQELLDETRAALARRYLLEPEVSVEEIAFLLGYSQVRAFQRAFKRWTGRSPSAFRPAD